jgi:acyloxyacyl hydrolase
VFSTFCKDSHNFLGKTVCDVANLLFDLIGLDDVNPHYSPEVTCQKAKLCPTPAQCVLFPTWPPNSTTAIATKMTTSEVVIPEIPGGGGDFWESLKEIIEFIAGKGGIKGNIKEVFDLHIPMNTTDLDDDRHATNMELRGGSWRGRDCNDNDGSIYPSRFVSTHPATVDHNCNGISGVDSTGMSFEEKFCKNTGQMGIVTIGDSAAAHFRIPPFIFDAITTFNDSDWDGMLHLVLNEMDWPECSWSTAFEDAANCPVSHALSGKINSMYQRMRARNLCNHRDYATVAVNGARTSNVAPPTGDIMAFTRDQQNDTPALVFFALIGNDVCNGHVPTLPHMTTVAEFKQYLTTSLQYLDTQLPKGSNVLFMPLADGLILHEVLHNRTHPIGVEYSQLYDYLICNDVAPCVGWMSPNATLRNLTQQRANNLSAVYTEVIAEQSYTHFDMDVLPMGMMKEFVAEWIAAGRDPAELIEPSDGFHPSTTSNMLIADKVWSWLEQNHPTWLSPVNPNNAEIAKMFGSQGGY